MQLWFVITLACVRRQTAGVMKWARLLSSSGFFFDFFGNRKSSILNFRVLNFPNGVCHVVRICHLYISIIDV